jgi:hypothetical protein
MMRECSECHRSYTAQDFVKEESKGMDAERRALGLEGVRFLYYSCPDCSHADIFVDVLPVGGETEEEYRARRGELEAAVRQMHDEHVGVTLTEKQARGPAVG